MLTFAAIAIAAFLLVGGSFLFGHDHDVAVDHDHDAGHDFGDASEPTISIFSTKVIGALLMGFGVAGAIGRHMQYSYVISSLVGLAAGLVLAGLMYLVLGVFYKQQATSLVATSTALDQLGVVTVTIGEGCTGEVGLDLNGTYSNFSASSRDGKLIPKGQRVRVVETMGSQLIVEAITGPAHKTQEL